MGSTPSTSKRETLNHQLQQKLVKVSKDLQNLSFLKQIHVNSNTEPLTLKPSQSVNIQKTKNQAKVKKVKDIRSMQSLQDIKLQNNENQLYLPEISAEQIQNVNVSKKVVKQLNPLNKKKMASDRVLIAKQSKTQNIISMIPIQSVQNKMDMQCRTKRYRVSKML